MSARSQQAVSQTCLIGAVAALGYALEIRDGFYDERALGWLTLALVLCAAGVLTFGRLPLARQKLELLPVAGACAAIAAHTWLLLSSSPGMYLEPRANMRFFVGGMLIQAALVAIGVSAVKTLARVWFPALLAWMIHASPSPRIDVVVVHREAIAAITSGRSPYAISFENIYGADSGFYNPKAVEGNRVLFGYPYPPLSLIAAAPGQWLAGDYRYAELVAWTGSAALIGFIGTGLVAQLAAVLVLLQPRGFFVLEQGWTEPIALLMLALTVFAMARNSAGAAWASGLLLVTKQYLAVAAPLVLRFAAGRRDTKGFLLRALVAGAVVTLPFLLWNPRALVENVLLLQMREPFRADSLSYLSWAARHGLGAGSFLWAVGAAAIALVLVMLVTPNTVAGLAASVALSTFLTFAFGSKAFCNYYFFVVGAMCCAIAAESHDTRT
jgi:hypothetical protein